MLRKTTGSTSPKEPARRSARARLASEASLRPRDRSRRADAYAAWIIRKQKAAESRLVCERDRLPELGVVTLSAYAPFLSLHEPEAARWASARRP